MMVGFAFVFSPRHGSRALDSNRLAQRENVGFDVDSCVGIYKANPRQDIRCLHPAMGVGIFLIRGWGP